MPELHEGEYRRLYREVANSEPIGAPEGFVNLMWSTKNSTSDDPGDVIVCLDQSGHYDNLYYIMTREDYLKLKHVEGRGLDIETLHSEDVAKTVCDILSRSKRVNFVKNILKYE